MTTLYGHTIRVLACPSCGAPIDASLAGGQARCDYCGTNHVIRSRDESADLDRAREGLRATMSESERHAQLRLQDRGPESVPESLASWIDGNGLATHLVPKAQSEWQLARQMLSSGSSAFGVQERFFYLTILLADHLEARSQRATLETAAELLSDARHRHVVRCRLARLAAQHGDIEGALAWLEACNPRSTDLVMDTAYRRAAATLAVMQREYGRVFELLGLAAGDVPLADREELGCDLLRIHASEKFNQGDKARAEMERAYDKHKSARLITELRAYEPLQLCVDSFAEVVRRRRKLTDESDLDRLHRERESLSLGIRALSAMTIRLPAWAAIAMIAIAVVRCAGDADPLMGAYGVALCPSVCADCTGPNRTVTVWNQTGPGEYTSDGAQYFCSTPMYPVRTMSVAQIESQARVMAGSELDWFAALGASYLMLLLLLMPAVPILAFMAHRAAAPKARELQMNIEEIARRLGTDPPISRAAREAPIGLIMSVAGPAVAAALAALLVVIGLAG